ncbi:MAG: energy transducer TonB [candidate division KSB1 bacterium]|nr:energy transducer TonB [candidate division KSB1 bacterium]
MAKLYRRGGESRLLRKVIREAAWAASFVLVACATGRIQPPALIDQGQLDYPLEAKLAQIQGDVLLGLDIDERGRVEEASVLTSSGHPVLDEAALRYAHKLRFRPARINRRPIRAHTELLLKFRLSQEKFDPDKWVNEVLGIQSDLRKAEGDKRRELLERLLEAYVAFVRFAQGQTDPRLSQRAGEVVLPTIRQRWHLFWGRHTAAFTVLDDYLERCADEPKLRTLAEGQLLEALLDTLHQLRLETFTGSGDRRQREQMIAAIEEYLQRRFPSTRGQLRPLP